MLSGVNGRPSEVLSSTRTPNTWPPETPESSGTPRTDFNPKVVTHS